MSATTSTVRSSGVAVATGLREAIRASGEDVVGFLQGQMSQDITAIAPGESRWSLLLHPQGKVSTWLRVTRLADTEFVLDVDAGWADEAVSRLERFKLRTKVDFEIMAWKSLLLFGPDAATTDVSGAALDVADQWAGLSVRVVFGETPVISGDAVEIDEDLVRALRVESGRPAMGSELDESTIPAAAGIVDQSVSFTKGCYTGQELVARIDSRGNNVPRRLVGLVAADSATMAAGASVGADGKEVGVITSAAISDELGSPVALAYVGRAVEAGAEVSVGDAVAVVRDLPLVAG